MQHFLPTDFFLLILLYKKPTSIKKNEIMSKAANKNNNNDNREAQLGGNLKKVSLEDPQALLKEPQQKDS